MIPTLERERSNPFRASFSSAGADPAYGVLPPSVNRDRRPARVLMVESNQDGTVGGSYQALFDLATRIDRAQFEPIAMFYRNNLFASRLRAEGVEVVLFDEIVQKERVTLESGGRVAKLFGLGSAVLRRWRLLRRLRIDLLHLNNSPGIGNDDWLPAARLFGIPCVASAMGDTRPPRRRIHQWLFRCFDLYIPVSHYMAGVLRREGVDPSRIMVVHLGVDSMGLRAQVVRSREAVRAELGVAADQLLVVMVGNLREWKGQREVIAALQLLPENVRARLRVCFAGATASIDAAYERELREAIAAGGLGNCVRFLGSRTDVPDLYAAADIAVHASITPEPFGLVVPEAMALNCAVIAAWSGGPAEVITPGTGLLCDPRVPRQYADALERLVRDESLRRAIAAAGPARAAIFSVQRTVEGTQRVYRRALERFSRRRLELTSSDPERCETQRSDGSRS